MPRCGTAWPGMGKGTEFHRLTAYRSVVGFSLNGWQLASDRELTAVFCASLGVAVSLCPARMLGALLRSAAASAITR